MTNSLLFPKLGLLDLTSRLVRLRPQHNVQEISNSLSKTITCSLTQGKILRDEATALVAL
ncbi:hypothetical protein HAX54_043492, partial [Datura stramonium]|nr:hypothetical protein [Datura stramonium]